MLREEDIRQSSTGVIRRVAYFLKNASLSSMNWIAFW